MTWLALLAGTKRTGPTAAAVSLKLAMRKLWNEHAVWTHQYIVAAIAGSAEADAAAKRLLRNQEDIGNAVASIYGRPAGDELTRLLKDHILIAVDLLAAAKHGNQKAFAQHDLRWTQNADEITDFLAGANPRLSKKTLSNLLALHLKLTKDSAVARLERRWAAEVVAYDDILVEITTLADTLSEGIVAQFPERFT